MNPSEIRSQPQRYAFMRFRNILQNASEGPITVLLIITIPLCTAATVLRFIATRRAGRSYGWDDIFSALALLAFLVYGGLSLGGFALTGGMSSDEFTLDMAVTTSKMAYAAAPFFEINQLFAKASLLVFYYRIFHTNRTFVFWTVVLAAIQLTWFIAIVFSLIFMCIPVRKWWDVLGTVDGWCMNDAALLAAEETVNSCVDFAVAILAICMVQKLKIKAYSKGKLSAAFIVGGLSGILGFIKIGEVYAVPDEHGKTNVTNGFWDLLQMASTTICGCAPICKTILPPRISWARLKTPITSRSGTAITHHITTCCNKLSSNPNPSHGEFISQVSAYPMLLSRHHSDRNQDNQFYDGIQTVEEGLRAPQSEEQKTTEIRQLFNMV